LFSVGLTLLALLAGGVARAEWPTDVGHHVGRYVLLSNPTGLHHIHLVSVLGHGAISETYLGNVLGNAAEVAVKLERAPVLAKGHPDGYEHEHTVLTRAHAPQLIESYGIGHLDGLSRQRALVLELARGQRLGVSAWNKDWSVPDAVRVTMQILRGARALHATNVRHNDIHLGNIQIVRRRAETLKLLDVGHAQHRDEAMRGWLGATVAPERPLGQLVASHGRVNADVFSAAATLAILLTGMDPKKQANEVTYAIPDVTRWVGDREVRLRDVIARGLEPDPARRYQTAQQLIDALRPFS
jgi:serine/threonine protein kinase